MKETEAANLWERFITEGYWDKFIFEGYWVGLLVIVLYAAESVLLVKTKIFEPGYSRVKDAVSRGHIVSARCINGGYDVNESSSGHRRDIPYGTYEYYAEGKRYEFRHVFRSMDSRFPPANIALYYLDNPKKVFMEDRYSPKRILFHLIPWGVPMIIYWLMYL